MGRRIGIWVTCSIVLMSVLGGTARAFGGAQSVDWQGMFTAPDGAPCPRSCLFGVMPARHTPEQALEILRAHPLTQGWTHSAPFRLETRYQDYNLAISFSVFADGVLDTLTLSVERDSRDAPLDSPLRLGDLLSTFGAPDYLHLSAQIDPLLIYVRQRLMIGVKSDQWRRMSPDLPVKHITLFRYGVCPSSAPLYTFAQWRGMTHQARQMASPPVQRYVRRVFGARVMLVPC
jgi:hypothetical protein